MSFATTILQPLRHWLTPRPTEMNLALATAGGPATVAERRRHVRRWGDPLEVVLRDGRFSKEAARAWVKNRSAGGLGVSSAQAFREGTVLQVRPTTAPDSVPWLILEVRGCSSDGTRFMLHCEYAESSPPEAVMLFR